MGQKRSAQQWTTKPLGKSADNSFPPVINEMLPIFIIQKDHYLAKETGDQGGHHIDQLIIIN